MPDAVAEVQGQTVPGLDGRAIGRRKVRLAGPVAVFTIKAISADGTERFEDQARRFLDDTRLQAIHWIYVTRELVTFKLIQKHLTKRSTTRK